MTGRFILTSVLALGLLGLTAPTAFATEQATQARAVPGVTAPQSYAAIAWSPSLNYYGNGRGSTATTAQNSALSICDTYAAAHSSGYYNDCASYGWVRNGFMAFFSDTRGSGQLAWAWGSNWGHTASKANNAAYQTCMSYESGRNPNPKCAEVGNIRSASYNSTAPTTGGGPTVHRQTAPLPPVFLAVNPISPFMIRLTWANASSPNQTPATGIEVSNGVTSQFVLAGTKSFDWSGLSPGTYMCFDVRSYNSFGDSWWEPDASPWYQCTSTPPVGSWPGTTGPYYANQYYGYPYPNAPVCQPDGTNCAQDIWGFYQGQCTSWVAYRLNDLNGIAFNNSYGGNGSWGNSWQWDSHAATLGILSDTTPAVGSVAWWQNSSQHVGGHVAVVEKVISSTSIVISEMNYDDSNGFQIQTLTQSGGNWLNKFIHIADLHNSRQRLAQVPGGVGSAHAARAHPSPAGGGVDGM